MALKAFTACPGGTSNAHTFSFKFHSFEIASNSRNKFLIASFLSEAEK
ncbi:hypothetical protein [Methylobacter marinus]|nr:hypothetical protein [Methylobacter marinus]